jgi:hypothetical protein
MTEEARKRTKKSRQRKVSTGSASHHKLWISYQKLLQGKFSNEFGTLSWRTSRKTQGGESFEKGERHPTTSKSFSPARYFNVDGEFP